MINAIAADTDLTNKSTQLEIIDRASQRLNHLLMFSCVALILWGAIAPLDVVSMAQGTVTPSSRIQRVQHLEGGIVREILVKEGESVTQGQALINLESTANSADYGEIAARVRALTADMARWDAEADKGDSLNLAPAFVKENQKLVERTQSLLNARRQTLQSQLAGQHDEIAQREQDITEISARLRNSRERLTLVEEQLAIDAKLVKEDLSNRYEQIERLKEANQLRSRIEEDNAGFTRAQSALEKARNNLNGIQSGYDQEMQTQRADTRRQLEESQERVQKYQDSLKRSVLRAPMSGVVKSLYVSTEGGVVSPGEIVLDLVPANDMLVIEARLPPQDIGHVRIGQKAFIQLASPEAAKLGQLDGTVEHISPDTMITKDGQAFYIVKIVTKSNHFGKGDQIYPLTPGVIVSAGIVTGERTVLAYLLSPLLSTAPFALSER